MQAKAQGKPAVVLNVEQSATWQYKYLDPLLDAMSAA